MIVAWSNNISCTIFKLLSSSVLNSAHVDCRSGALLFMHSRMHFSKSFRRVHFSVYLHFVQVTKVEQLMNPARSRTRRFSFSVANFAKLCYVIHLLRSFVIWAHFSSIWYQFYRWCTWKVLGSFAAFSVNIKIYARGEAVSATRCRDKHLLEEPFWVT